MDKTSSFLEIVANQFSFELLFIVLLQQDTLSVFLWTGERPLMADFCRSGKAAIDPKPPLMNGRSRPKADAGSMEPDHPNYTIN